MKTNDVIPKRQGSAVPGLGALIALVASMVVVIIGAAAWKPWELTPPAFRFGPTTEEHTEPSFSPPPQPGEQPGIDVNTDMPTWFKVACVALLLLIAALVVWLIVRAIVRAWRPPTVLEEVDYLDQGESQVIAAPNLEELADAVEIALRRLDTARSTTDAIITAWVEVERVAAAQGILRLPSQTASDLTAAVLAATPAPAGQVRILLGLFHAARYGTGARTRTDVSQARSALEAILTSLRPSGGAGA